MIAAIVVTLFGIGAIVLGVQQLRGAIPALQRTGTVSAYVNLCVGALLILLGVLHAAGRL